MKRSLNFHLQRVAGHAQHIQRRGHIGEMVKSHQQQASNLFLVKRALHLPLGGICAAPMVRSTKPLFAAQERAVKNLADCFNRRVRVHSGVRASSRQRRKFVSRRDGHDQCVSKNLCGANLLKQCRGEVARVIQQHNARCLRGARHLQSLIYWREQAMCAVAF